MSTSKFIKTIVNLVARPPLDLSKTSIYVYFIQVFASKFTFLGCFCTENFTFNKHAPHPPMENFNALGVFITNNTVFIYLCASAMRQNQGGQEN